MTTLTIGQRMFGFRSFGQPYCPGNICNYGLLFKLKYTIYNTKSAARQLDTLPEEVLLIIFQHLNYGTLNGVALVSGRINHVATSPTLCREINLTIRGSDILAVRNIRRLALVTTYRNTEGTWIRSTSNGNISVRLDYP